MQNSDPTFDAADTVLRLLDMGTLNIETRRIPGASRLRITITFTPARLDAPGRSKAVLMLDRDTGITLDHIADAVELERQEHFDGRGLS